MSNRFELSSKFIINNYMLFLHLLFTINIFEHQFIDLDRNENILTHFILFTATSISAIDGIEIRISEKLVPPPPVNL